MERGDSDYGEAQALIHFLERRPGVKRRVKRAAGLAPAGAALGQPHCPRRSTSEGRRWAVVAELLLFKALRSASPRRATSIALESRAILGRGGWG